MAFFNRGKICVSMCVDNERARTRKIQKRRNEETKDHSELEFKGFISCSSLEFPTVKLEKPSWACAWGSRYLPAGPSTCSQGASARPSVLSSVLQSPLAAENPPNHCSRMGARLPMPCPALFYFRASKTSALRSLHKTNRGGIEERCILY